MSNNVKICSNCLTQLPKVEYQSKKSEMAMDFVLKFSSDTIELSAGYKTDDKKIDSRKN